MLSSFCFSYLAVEAEEGEWYPVEAMVGLEPDGYSAHCLAVAQVVVAEEDGPEVVEAAALAASAEVVEAEEEPAEAGK